MFSAGNGFRLLAVAALVRLALAALAAGLPLDAVAAARSVAPAPAAAGDRGLPPGFAVDALAFAVDPGGAAPDVTPGAVPVIGLAAPCRGRPGRVAHMGGERPCARGPRLRPPAQGPPGAALPIAA